MFERVRSVVRSNRRLILTAAVLTNGNASRLTNGSKDYFVPLGQVNSSSIYNVKINVTIVNIVWHLYRTRHHPKIPAERQLRAIERKTGEPVEARSRVVEDEYLDIATLSWWTRRSWSVTTWSCLRCAA